MYKWALRNPLDPFNLIATLKYLHYDKKYHPTFCRTFGTSVFCGEQGEGKTLSAVQYVLKFRQKYPRSILVTNVAIKDFPFNTEMYEPEPGVYALRKIDDHSLVNTDLIKLHSLRDDFEPINIEYTGLDMLKHVSNAEYGVIFLIDEIHLELNSLESKNIDIDIMVEISQQRKQRKHIVGTSQKFMRMAKPLREQIYDIVICNCFFNVLQYNKYINGATATEKNGKLEAEVKGRYLWFHAPHMYEQYNTYTKMKRYNKEWNGRKRVDNLFDKEEKVVEFHK